MNPESIVKTYRWGVVSTDEPPGVRTIRGFVSVLELQTPSGAPTDYRIVFFDIDGHPLQNFSVDDFRLFACAAGLATEELGLSQSNSPNHLAALVVLA